MILGFIGTGKIASSVIKGICKSNIKYNKILISKRNRKISSRLKKDYKKVSILKKNQEIVDKSNWVFLSITPEVGKKIIKKLNFRPEQTIISFISSINLKDLKDDIRVKAKIVRAIPLPPISLREGPVPLFPPNKKVRKFFDQLGKSIEIKNEKLSINFWSISGMMASYYEMLKTISIWLTKRGIRKSDAQKYVTSLFLALSKDAAVNSHKDLKKLVKESYQNHLGQ